MLHCRLLQIQLWKRKISFSSYFTKSDETQLNKSNHHFVNGLKLDLEVNEQ